MIPTNRISTYPGEILLQEFLEPMEQTQKALADHPVFLLSELMKLCAGNEALHLTLPGYFLKH